MSSIGTVGSFGQAVSIALCALLTAAAAPLHAAEQWPQRPVRWVLSFGAPGGSPDIIARTTSPRLSEIWGRQVVIDPRSGAGGVVGTEIGARAPNDGYTMVLVSPAHAINPALRKNLPYDSMKDFDPVTKLAEVPNILIVHPSLGVRNARELAALAKAKPGAINFGSAGIGSSQHLAGELFCKVAGVKMVHIPFKSGALVAIDLVAGRVHTTFGSATSLPHVRAGKLNALAVTTLKRSPAMPDIPTMDESGFPGFEASAWYGLLVPTRTPAAIVAKMHRDFSTVLQMREVREVLSPNTIEPVPSPTPKHFAAFLAAETAKWGTLVRESGARAD